MASDWLTDISCRHDSEGGEYNLRTWFHSITLGDERESLVWMNAIYIYISIMSAFMQYQATEKLI